MSSSSSHPGAPLETPTVPELFISREAIPGMFSRRTALGSRLARWADRVGLVTLMLAIGTLLLRPSDIVPELEGASLYELSMVLCICATLPRVLGQLRSGSLRENAISVLVLLFVPAVVLSHLVHADTWSARTGGLEAGKACLLFLLITGLVNSWDTLRAMLLATALSVLGITVLSLMNYYGVLHIPALQSVAQPSLDESDPTPLLRLCATGIFNDPNDYSLMLVLCLCVSVYVLGWRRLGPRRWLAAIPFVIFGHALVLTHSRGGLMSAGAAAATFLVVRFGWRNAIPLIAVLSLLMLAPFWGRQTNWNLSDPDDTFQARLDLWSRSFDEFRGAPFFGIGRGKLADEIGQVAHNSYLHAFAELGAFGGTVFIGAFALVLWALWKARPAQFELTRLRPCVLAITFGYAAGLLTLSRCYTVPTQMILALGTAYLRLGAATGGAAVPRLDGKSVKAVVLTAIGFLAATYVFLRVMLLRG